jgi:hypothetical protein
MRRGALRLKQLVGPRSAEADAALAERLMSCSQAGPSGAGLALSAQRAGFSSFVAQAYGSSRTAALLRFLLNNTRPRAVATGLLRSNFASEGGGGLLSLSLALRAPCPSAPISTGWAPRCAATLCLRACCHTRACRHTRAATRAPPRPQRRPAAWSKFKPKLSIKSAPKEGAERGGAEKPDGDKPEIDLGSLAPWLLLGAVGLAFLMVRCAAGGARGAGRQLGAGKELGAGQQQLQRSRSALARRPAGRRPAQPAQPAAVACRLRSPAGPPLCRAGPAGRRCRRSLSSSSRLTC